MAAIYKVGRKWTYKVSTVTSGLTTDVSYTQEVKAVTNGKAQLEVVTTANGSTTTKTDEVDLTKPYDPASQLEASAAADGSTSTFTQTTSTTESVTVPAGTYASATKLVGQLQTTTAGATSTQDVTSWNDLAIGLVKSITTGTQTAGGLTVTFTATTELQAVVN
jgi:hypothetical protein